MREIRESYLYIDKITPQVKMCSAHSGIAEKNLQKIPLRVLSAFNLKNQTSPKFRIWSYRFSFIMTVVNNSFSEGVGTHIGPAGNTSDSPCGF